MIRSRSPESALKHRSASKKLPHDFKIMISLRSLPVFLLGATFPIVGCNKPAEPPKPVAVEEAPAGLQEAFKETKGPRNEAVDRLVEDATAALQAQDYSRALILLESLSRRADLTGPQREFVTRSMLAAHKALAANAAAGNPAAAKALEQYRATK